MSLTIKQADQQIRDNLIVKHFAGSYAYGTSLPTSDVDFRGIFVADPANIRTPFYPIREVDDQTEEDTKIYELNQFMKLCLDCNPNIIETLWVRYEEITYSSSAYELLRKAAPQLLSSKIAFTTSGYAISQLKRIKGHNKWINNPQPEQAPQQVDFVSLVHNFTTAQKFKINLRDFYENHRLVPYSSNTFGLYQMNGYHPFNITSGNLNIDYEGDSHALGTPLYIIKFNNDVYTTQKEQWSHYWTWKKNRNVARSKLEEEHSFDTKHAMHLVRLLRMGEEALTTGIINVYRPDAAELLSIRNGAWTYEEIIKYAEDLDNHIRNDLYTVTNLPKYPDVKLAASLIIQIQEMVWTQNK